MPVFVLYADTRGKFFCVLGTTGKYILADGVSETEESFLEFLYRLADPILRTEYTDVIMPMYFIWEDFFVIVMPCYALLACSY